MFERLLHRDDTYRRTVWKMLIPSIIYMSFYLLWWSFLEHTERATYTVIHTSLDDFIPFAEIFVIPYLFWFFYVVGVVLFFLVTLQKEDYYRLITFLYIGMTIFLIVSTLAPNIHDLRPDSFERHNLFTVLVGMFYRVDTPTNLWPSIHVYNAVGVHIAVMHADCFKEHGRLRGGSLTACVLITVSTVFIKQHSVFDVLTALLMCLIMYLIIYRVTVFGEGSRGQGYEGF